MAAINTIQYLYCPLRYMCADQFGDTLNLFLDSMNFRLTKTLESIIARAAFDAEKNNFANYLIDRLLLLAFDADGSHAQLLVRSLVEEWQLAQMRSQIEIRLRETVVVSSAETDSTRTQFFAHISERLAATSPVDIVINTGHILLLATSDRTTLTYQAFRSRNITHRAVAELMSRLAVEEDLRYDLRADIRDEKPRRLLDLSSLERDMRSGEDCRTSILEKLTTDLTRMAQEGHIDPVVGRDREIARMIQILCRRKKNNPVLIGEAGVGKSAIVEGLALRIVAGNVPFALRSKRIFSLDMATLVAGTKFRGEFEERMQQLLADLSRREDVILFVDEIHTIVGAGSTQGGLDTANILKPALARGLIRCIGATTLDEYRSSIERDAALERRFQRIMVESTTREQTFEILQNLRPRYERHHSVRYTDAALGACVDLADRYLSDRQFPDKAIDIMDEAGAEAHLCAMAEPSSIAAIEHGLQEAAATRRRAVEELVYERAAEARLRELALTSKLNESRAQWQREMQLNPATVDVAQIEQVVASVTGVPVEQLSLDDRNRLQGLSERLNARVVGQRDAVERVVGAIHRSRAGLRDGRRPMGVFMFVGPTGVGKTLLAKELARDLFDRREGLIRFDMSEYGEKHNVARLIGSPPGYVGYGEGGQLTEAVRRRPYSVVLFDEVEKAHSDIFNLMLQIFDDGILTDGNGRKVDFSNTVIIMTSNVGSRGGSSRSARIGYSTLSQSLLRESEQRNRRAEYDSALAATFAPEFLNRIDAVAYFRELEREDIEQIVDIEIGQLISRAESLGITLNLSIEAKRSLAQVGYDAQYGARSLKRTILERVEEPLARMIINGEVERGDSVAIESLDGELRLLRESA